MAGLGRARGLFWPRARACRSTTRIVFPQWGQTAQGVAWGRGAHKDPAGSNAKGSLPRPTAGSKPARALQLYFLWLSGALFIIYFFSLCFIFIFKLPAGLDAVHSPRCLGARRADGRSRLGLSPTARPAAAGSRGGSSRGAGAGAGGFGGEFGGKHGGELEAETAAAWSGVDWRGAARGGGAGEAGVGWGQRGVEAVPCCAPAWPGQHEFSPTLVQNSGDLAVIM